MKRLLSWLVPNEKAFFELLKAQAHEALEGAKFLQHALGNGAIKHSDIERMHEIERAGDKARYATVLKLNQSLITPFDREDIYELSSTLDDILDDIDRLMHHFETYNKPKPSKELKEMAKVLLETVEETHLTVTDLKAGGVKLLEHCRKINELEEKADVIYRRALSQLFVGKDAKKIIIEKDLMDCVEEGIDRCQRAAILIEGIIIKTS